MKITIQLEIDIDSIPEIMSRINYVIREFNSNNIMNEQISVFMPKYLRDGLLMAIEKYYSYDSQHRPKKEDAKLFGASLKIGYENAIVFSNCEEVAFDRVITIKLGLSYLLTGKD